MCLKVSCLGVILFFVKLSEKHFMCYKVAPETYNLSHWAFNINFDANILHWNWFQVFTSKVSYFNFWNRPPTILLTPSNFACQRKMHFKSYISKNIRMWNPINFICFLDCLKFLLHYIHLSVLSFFNFLIPFKLFYNKITRKWPAI